MWILLEMYKPSLYLELIWLAILLEQIAVSSQVTALHEQVAIGIVSSSKKDTDNNS